MALVEGQRRFAAPPERVFALLTEPAVIASAMPAVRSHEVVDADHWRAKVKPPLPFAEVHLSGMLDRITGHGLDGVARRQAERTLDAVERALTL